MEGVGIGLFTMLMVLAVAILLSVNYYHPSRNLVYASLILSWILFAVLLVFGIVAMVNHNKTKKKTMCS